PRRVAADPGRQAAAIAAAARRTGTSGCTIGRGLVVAANGRQSDDWSVAAIPASSREFGFLSLCRSQCAALALFAGDRDRAADAHGIAYSILRIAWRACAANSNGGARAEQRFV